MTKGKIKPKKQGKKIIETEETEAYERKGGKGKAGKGKGLKGKEAVKGGEGLEGTEYEAKASKGSGLSGKRAKKLAKQLAKNPEYKIFCSVCNAPFKTRDELLQHLPHGMGGREASASALGFGFVAVDRHFGSLEESERLRVGVRHLLCSASSNAGAASPSVSLSFFHPSLIESPVVKQTSLAANLLELLILHSGGSPKLKSLVVKQTKK
nr:hypothetical protein Iba_chr03fCG1330 [Ipomoea batatas]